MTRRKSALLSLLLLLTLLILSPWASAPSRTAPVVPEPDGRPSAAALPAPEAVPVHLRVAAALNEAEFRFLQEQNTSAAYRNPDTAVELIRVDPDTAFAEFAQAAKVGEAADVMLLENEWVKNFAASGYLLPADGAFVGEALAQQFDALSAAVKWNGYLWAVPRDFDPYVLVWNLSVIRGLLGDTAVTPQGPAQWAVLAEKSRASGKSVSWLAIHKRDAFAWLAWLQTVTAQRTDTLWSDGSGIWNGSPRGDAMALLERERQGVAYASGFADTAQWIVDGNATAAVLPYSEAIKLTLPGQDHGAGGIVMDRSAWSLPYDWPRGRSFAVSAGTQVEDAARQWIAVMTEEPVQQANERSTGKLPVYLSMYGADSTRASLLSEATAGTFPNMPPAEDGPHIPKRLAALSQLWTEWADGRLKLQEWIRRWPETSADF